MSLITTIIGDIIDFNSQTLPVIIYGEKNEQEEPILAVLDSNNTVVDTSNHKYELVPDKESYNVLLYYNFQSPRNIISATALRSLLRTIYDKKYGTKDSPRNDELNRILNILRTPLIGPRTSYDISEYIQTFYASFMEPELQAYKAKIIPIQLSGIFIKPRYPIIYIPRDLQIKLNHIAKYFDEIKSRLEYNPDTGYYSINIKNVKLDVLCRHEYLQFSGVSIQEISLECHKNGKCRYCGQPMPPSVEDTSLTLPSKVFSIVYVFIDTISTSMNESVLLNTLIKFIIQESSKHKELTSEDKIISFVYLFLYKCYIVSENSIAYVKSKISGFLSECKNQAALLGISKNKIGDAVEELFPNSDQIQAIFKDSAYNENNFEDSFPLTVLFDDDNSKTLQKIYEENKMEEFNEKVFITYLKQWNYELPIKPNDKESSKFYLKEPSKENMSSVLLEFYKKVWKSFCPVNGSHVYKNKKCEMCGITEDGKNIAEVFNKYSPIISNTYVYVDNNTNNFTAKKRDDIDLSKYKDTDLFHVYLTQASQYMENLITKGLRNEPEKALNLIASTIKIDNIQKENASKYLSYMIEKNMISKSMLLSSLLSIYIPIHKVVYM